MEKNNNIILTISILASDRLSTLERCLESLNPIRKSLKTELIVVETTDDPEVHDLVLKYADKVERFKWCDDFAEARNVGIRLAEGEWFMFIDDDEWFAEPESLIEFFCSGEYKEYGFANHRIKNFCDPEWKEYRYSWGTRLAKREPELRFHGRVHEILKPLTGKCKDLYATSYHTGYVYRTQEESYAHFERNRKLLEKAELEEPDNLRWKEQMLQEYMAVREWDRMAAYGEKTVAYCLKAEILTKSLTFSSILVAYMIALFETEQYEKAKQVYTRGSDILSRTIVLQAYFELCMAQVHWALGEYAEAELHAKSYIGGYEVYCKDPQKYIREIKRPFAADVFLDNRRTRAYSIILGVRLKCGDKNALYELYPKLMWNKEDINGYCDVEVDILRCLLENKDDVMLDLVLKESLSTKYIAPRMIKAISDYKERDERIFWHILNRVKQLEIRSWYPVYAELLTADGRASKEKILELGKRFVLTFPYVFEIPAEVRVVLEKYEIKCADLYQFIEFSVWQDLLKEYLMRISMEQADALQKELGAGKLTEDIRYHYFMMIYTEQKILSAEQNSFLFDEMTEWITKFAEHTALTYECMYGEELQAAEVENWPKKYQAARWLVAYLEIVDKDIKSALACLAKIIAVYPRLADSMRYYLERIQIEILMFDGE